MEFNISMKNIYLEFFFFNVTFVAWKIRFRKVALLEKYMKKFISLSGKILHPSLSFVTINFKEQYVTLR